MPRGIPNNNVQKPAEAPAPAAAAPLIIIQPEDAAIRINAYDLTPEEAADALRLAIMHIKAKTSRVLFVETVVREPRPAWAPRRVAPASPPPDGEPRRRGGRRKRVEEVVED